MKRGLAGIAVIGVFLCWASLAAGSKVRKNVPYVQSGPDRFTGVFYARCIPTGDEGSAGQTELFRVREAGDELLARYDWYAPGGLVLAWSPLKGKVAVLSIMREQTPDDWKKREQLRFALGGDTLARYTSDDLLTMGATQSADSVHGLYAGYRIIGVEQVPQTNEYDFVIEVAQDKRLRFDITTGQLRAATSQSARP